MRAERLIPENSVVSAGNRLLLRSGPAPAERSIAENSAVNVENQGHKMTGNTPFFVLRKKAVPEVLLKVVEAKRLLDSGRMESVQDAADAVGISRSSFYKYKDDIFPYHENAKGKTITLVIQLDDEPGLLSTVLGIIAEFHANILTIHQSVPVNGIASLSLSVDIFPATGNVEQMKNSIESVQGIHYAKILARE